MVLQYAVGEVPSNENLEVCRRTGGLPSHLDASLLLLPTFSLIITSCFSVASQVGRNI